MFTLPERIVVDRRNLLFRNYCPKRYDFERVPLGVLSKIGVAPGAKNGPSPCVSIQLPCFRRTHARCTTRARGNQKSSEKPGFANGSLPDFIASQKPSRCCI